MSFPLRLKPAEAIAYFDSLEPATEAQMIGRWQGEELQTGHPMEGLLAASYWHGKEFLSADAVHPLVHELPLWGRRAINPALIPFKLVMKLPARSVLGPVIFPVLAPVLWTRKPKARLRTVAFRGRLHAAMCYDAKPIHDIFAHESADVMLGWMDFKGMSQPYFFRLRRR